MARPNKTGIDYFPFDVDFFQDDKIEFVTARFDEKGELITIKLLCLIFKNGYYYKWNEDTALLFSKRAGRNCSPALANDVVNELVKRGFFDRSIFNSFGVLTSKGIQKRFIQAISERKEVEIISDYWLIDVPKNTKTTVFLVSTPINGVSPPINDEILPTYTQSIVNKSIVNNDKSNVGNIECGGANAANAATTTNRKTNFYNSLIPFVEKYGKEMVREFYEYWCEPNLTGKKLKFEMEKTWDTARRLATWNKNEEKFYGSNKNQRNNANINFRPTADELSAAVEIGMGLAAAEKNRKRGT